MSAKRTFFIFTCGCELITDDPEGVEACPYHDMCSVAYEEDVTEAPKQHRKLASSD